MNGSSNDFSSLQFFKFNHLHLFSRDVNPPISNLPKEGIQQRQSNPLSIKLSEQIKQQNDPHLNSLQEGENHQTHSFSRVQPHDNETATCSIPLELTKQISNIKNIALGHLDIKDGNNSQFDNNLLPTMTTLSRQREIESWAENEVEELLTYESSDSDISSTQNNSITKFYDEEPIKSESPFFGSDLVVFKDNYKGFLPTNGIMKSSLIKMEEQFKAISEGQLFKIKGSPEFKDRLLLLFSHLLTRKTGRMILNKLINQIDELKFNDKNISFEQTDKGSKIYCLGKEGREEFEILLGYPDNALPLTRTALGQSKLITDSELTNYTFILAHEMIHLIHELSEEAELNTVPPTIDPAYHDLEEQRTISGWGQFTLTSPEDSSLAENNQNQSLLENGDQKDVNKLFNEPYSPNYNYSALNENALRADFNSDFRVNHLSVDLPKNGVMPEEVEVNEEFVTFLKQIIAAELPQELQSFLQDNNDVSQKKIGGATLINFIMKEIINMKNPDSQLVMMQVFLEECPGIDLNDTIYTDNHTTLLYLACKNRNLNMMSLLFDCGADVNKGGPMGRTPLILSIELGYKDNIAFLLGTNKIDRAITNYGETAEDLIRDSALLSGAEKIDFLEKLTNQS